MQSKVLKALSLELTTLDTSCSQLHLIHVENEALHFSTGELYDTKQGTSLTVARSHVTPPPEVSDLVFLGDRV